MTEIYGCTNLYLSVYEAGWDNSSLLNHSYNGKAKARGADQGKKNDVVELLS